MLKKKQDRKKKQKSGRDKKKFIRSKCEKKLMKRNVLSSLKPKEDDFKMRSRDAKIKRWLRRSNSNCI